MTFTGAEALAALLEAIRDIRREEDELLERLGRGAELVAALKAHESELYRQLLAVRLDSETRAALATELGGLEAAVSAALATLEQHLRAAAANVREHDDALAALAQRRLALQADIGKQQRELDGLARKARPALRSDPAYLEARAAASDTARKAQAAARKAEAALAAHAGKDQAFRREPLFMYLFSRGFLTGSYRGNALSAWLDAQVARVIDYPRARQLFLLQSDLPVRWRDHAEALADAARRAAQALVGLESVAVDAAGGQASREALAGLATQLTALDREILVAEDRRDEAIRSWRDLAQGGEPGFAGALEAITTALNRPVLSSMLAEARATPKGRDVDVLQQIDQLRQRAGDEAAETREQRVQLKTLAARRRDLEDIAYEIKAQRLDAPGSRFAEDDLVGGALNAFLRAEMTASTYWDRWRAAHSFAEDSGRPPLARTSLSRPRGGNRAETLVTAA